MDSDPEFDFEGTDIIEDISEIPYDNELLGPQAAVISAILTSPSSWGEAPPISALSAPSNNYPHEIIDYDSIQAEVEGLVEYENGFTEDHEEQEVATSILQRPTLKNAAFHGFAGRFVYLATRDTEATKEGVLLSFLTRFSAEIGNKAHFYVGDKKHQCRLYTCLVGPTALGRKGTSYAPVQRLFDAQELKKLGYQPAKAIPGPLSTGEGIVAQVQDDRIKIVRGKSETIPGIADKRLFVLEEELSGSLATSKRDGNTLSAVLRQAWDDGNIHFSSKSDPTSASNTHISILAHITAEELKVRFNQVDILNGFANRFIWGMVLGTKSVPFPKAIPSEQLGLMREQLVTICKFAAQAGEMTLSSEAIEAWKTIYLETANSTTRPHPATVRSTTITLRLAAIYALLDLSNTIKKVHLEVAHALMEYANASATILFSRMKTNPEADRILKLLESGPKSRSEISNLFGNNQTKEKLTELINELVLNGQVETTKVSTNGRPKTLIKKTGVTNDIKPLKANFTI